MATKKSPASPAKAQISGLGKKSTQMPQLPAGAPRLPKGRARVLSTTEAYKGKIFSVYTEHVIEPNGVEATRDVVRHNGSVVIFAVDEKTNPRDPRVLIERQFRHAADQYMLELPAGRVEPGESTLAAAKRELIEETGYRARRWQKMVRYYASPGFVAEWMEIYLATDIVAGEAHPEEDEKIETHAVPLSQLVEMIVTGRVRDGKTIVGTMLYRERRDRARRLK